MWRWPKNNVGNAGKTDDVWACYQCTYINEIRFVTCQMCGALGPESVPDKGGNVGSRDIDEIIEALERQKKSVGAHNFEFLIY